MAERDPRAGGQDAILEEQQPAIERLGLQEVPNYGRFCGYCNRRLQDESPARCPLCGSDLAEAGTVDRVPDEVLAIYMAKRKREGLMVNTFAYVGLFVGAVVSLAMAVFLAGWWRLAAVLMLVFGSWYLANVFGVAIGGRLGYRWGASIRNRRWREYVARRDAGGARPGGSAVRDEEGLSRT